VKTMPTESSLRKYLKVLGAHREQLDNALEDDIRNARMKQASKGFPYTMHQTWPLDGKAITLLETWNGSQLLHTLFKEAFAEVVRADFLEIAHARLEKMRSQHEELLRSAFYDRFRSSYAVWESHLRQVQRTWTEAHSALDSISLGIEIKLQEDNPRAAPQAPGGDDGISPPTDQFSEVRTFAKLNFKGKCQIIVHAVCDKSGSIPLKDLAELVGWKHPWDGAFQSRKTYINGVFKQKKFSWKLSRANNRAELKWIGKAT
jgi:hypothetical protein